MEDSSSTTLPVPSRWWDVARGVKQRQHAHSWYEVDQLATGVRRPLRRTVLTPVRIQHMFAARERAALMHVRSGAGNFHLEVQTLDVEDGQLVLRGIVDDWPSRTYVEPWEVGQILRLTLRPTILLFLLRLGWGAALTAGRRGLRARHDRKGG